MSDHGEYLRDRYVVEGATYDRLEADRDRLRDALRQADEELVFIADDAPEGIGERIDSVRALLKDAAITPVAPFDEQGPASAPAIAPHGPSAGDR